MKFLSDSPHTTIEIGRILGQMLGPGSVVCLEGNLGAGKTQFAKGVALGLGVSDHVTSPTFTIINEYEGRLPFYHVDAYRLGDPDEAYELGLEEYLFGTGVTLVEWPERVSFLLPDEYLTVAIHPAESDENARELELLSTGRSYEDIVREVLAVISAETELLRS